MAQITTDNNAQELLTAINEGLSGELTTDNTATELVEFINNAISSGGSGTFPANTILPSAIGSLEQGEDIGGMTIADFIKYGINGATKKFSFLHYSDAHGSYQSTAKAAGMVGDSTREDYDPNLSFALYTGDGISNTAMANANNGKHLLIMGNHDANDSYGHRYANFIAPLKGFMPSTQVDKNLHYGGEVQGSDEEGTEAYWYKDFPLIGGSKVRLFGTCEYEYNGNDGSSTYTTVIRQNQVDWLIEKMNELTENDYFIVAVHQPPTTVGDSAIIKRRRQNKFCSSALWSWTSSGGQNIYRTIVDAYKNDKQVNKEMSNYGSVKVRINVDWSDSTRKKATFLCFLCGHEHGDYHGGIPISSTVNSNILLLAIDTCKSSAGSGDESDIPTSVRTANGNILINKVTVDFYKRTIRVDRIGAQEVPARIVGENASVYAHDSGDPNGTYPAITRDYITFDFDANVITES